MNARNVLGLIGDYVDARRAMQIDPQTGETLGADRAKAAEDAATEALEQFVTGRKRPAGQSRAG